VRTTCTICTKYKVTHRLSVLTRVEYRIQSQKWTIIPDEDYPKAATVRIEDKIQSQKWTIIPDDRTQGGGEEIIVLSATAK
jgi:hypothetical protein